MIYIVSKINNKLNKKINNNRILIMENIGKIYDYLYFLL